MSVHPANFVRARSRALSRAHVRPHVRPHVRAFVRALAASPALVVALSCGGSSDTGSTPPPAAVAPSLAGVSPATGAVGGTTNVTLSGSNFLSGASVAVSGTGVTATGVTLTGSSSIAAGFVIDAAATVGAHTVTVATSAGTSGGQTFTVTPRAPTLTAIAPAAAALGVTVPVTLTGTNFITGATTVGVSDAGVTVSNVNVVTATSLTASFAIGATATAGARTVTVTTAGGTSGTQTFTLSAPVVSPNPWPVPAYKGATGKGVVIAILDRGIQYDHQDFIRPDGKTRIKAMLDMTGQTFCAATNPPPIEYTEAQINAALAGGPALGMRDAVGHGNVTAGIATGNGRAGANGKYAGVAPEADMIIVKMTSDGAPAHGTQAAEAGFTACHTQALDWLDAKLAALNEPAAVLINSGVLLWGPTDGTSVLSRKIDALFGNKPGRIFISPSGDEGNLATHAGGTYTNTPVSVNFKRASAASSQFAMWYSGAQLATITLVFDDGTTLGPIAPGGSVNQSGVVLTQYQPGAEFFPVTSTGGDRFVSISITGHATTGHLTIQGTGAGTGKFDIYSDAVPVSTFTDHLVAGRLTEQSSTKTVLVVGAYVNRNAWTDLDGLTRGVPADVPGALWAGSSGGPTRDGRMGMDIVAGGEGVFAAYSTTSYWGTLRGAMVSDGGGFYGEQGATSGASPILLGTAALMLQLRPTLTSEQARAIIHSTAISDANTGAVPNNNWGYGKLNITGIIDQLAPASGAAAKGAPRR